MAQLIDNYKFDQAEYLVGGFQVTITESGDDADKGSEEEDRIKALEEKK